MPVYALDNDAPILEGECWIAPSADVIGRVRLGADVGVWFGAVLRGDEEDIVIGEGSNIQDGAVIHSDPGFPAVVGRDVTVDHRAILHGCTIGDGSLVGMGAVIMNGAVIGKDCIVGAGALVTEGKTFPDRSLIVGSPATATRELPERAVARIRMAGPAYVAKWKRYAAGMKGV